MQPSWFSNFDYVYRRPAKIQIRPFVTMLGVIYIYTCLYIIVTTAREEVHGCY